MPIRPLSKELQKKAIEGINEDPKRIQNDLNIIHEWAKKQAHLKIRADDQWLLNILRCCKYDLKLAQEKIDALCTLKSILPEIYNNRDPFLPEIQGLLKLGICLPLPKTADPAAPRVILIRIELMDLTKIKPEDAIKQVMMIMDIMLNEDDNCVVAGGNLLIDNNGISKNHVLQGPVYVKKYYRCLNDASPLRPQGFHLVNAPSYAQLALNMFGALLSNELFNMVHIYDDGNNDELFKTIPLSVLPDEYGGSGGTLEDLTVQWKEKVESYRDWFLEDAQYRSDETKRPKKPKYPEGLIKEESLLFQNIMELD